MQQQQMEREGATSPPGYYSPQQMKSYLQELRTNRPARPTGSRPPPAHFKTWAARETTSVPAIPTFASLQAAAKDGTEAVVGKALVQPPRHTPSPPHREGATSPPYREDARRSAERRESVDLRAAMDALDLQAETKLYESARDEAAEIVWKHRHPNAVENNPNAPYAYPGPGRKNLQRPKLMRTRSRSVGVAEEGGQDLQRANSKLRKRRSLGSSRSSSLQDPPPASPHEDADGTSASAHNGVASPDRAASPHEASAGDDIQLKIAKASSDLPQQRKTSGSHRKHSASLFQNPNDHIYEETDDEVPPAPAPTPFAAEPLTPAPLPLGMRRNPFTRFQSIKGNPMARSSTDPVVTMRRFDRFEIHRNEPTQSRNAAYTLNTNKSKLAHVAKADVENEPEVKLKDGKEIRSDELRAATGFSLKDRSPKLPTPTMVSDRPGRPIVSFEKDYGVIELREEKSIFPADPPAPRPAPQPLEKAVTEPALPTRKSVFERPTSRNGAAPSPWERPAIRSGPSPAPLKDFSRSSSPAPSGGRPSTPKGPFANKSALGRFNSTAETTPTKMSADPPVPADPYALPTTSANPLPADPYALPSRAQPSIPSVSVSESRPASRGRFNRPQSVSNVPIISVSETPVSSHGRSGSIPSIGVTPAVSVSASPTAPPRGRFNRVSTTQAVPTVSINEPPSMTRGHSFNAPVINLPSDIPAIAVNDTPSSRPLPTINAPSVNVSEPPSTRPLPDPRNYKKHPPPPSSGRAPSNARTHWTPTTVRTGAQCTHCGLSIAGRIVSAAGCRFHPSCFACYQCGEKLECVAFYPEPSAKHNARVDRIRARASGQDIEFIPGWDTPEQMRQLEDQDGTDESPRFYCHLDFHECFSPRCKSCKTPIEGEVIVACGAEWHPGHFFCAQCGDPFDSNTPFVEKDGYAWCVGCHTHRFSAKCKGCRKPVVDTVVKALGAEWHAGCFCCVECKGEFVDGRYFLRGESQDPVCVRCEERRLKA